MSNRSRFSIQREIEKGLISVPEILKNEVKFLDEDVTKEMIEENDYETDEDENE